MASGVLEDERLDEIERKLNMIIHALGVIHSENTALQIVQSAPYSRQSELEELRKEWDEIFQREIWRGYEADL